MSPSLALLLFTAVLLHGASCQINARDAAQGLLSNLDHRPIGKRQGVTYTFQCINNKLNAAFSGNTSIAVSRCRATVSAAADLQLGSFDNTVPQTTINIGFRTFCMPYCGNVLLRAYTECGAFDQLDGAVDFLIGLCATNQDGKKCYESYTSALNLRTSTERTCNARYQRSGTCDASCQSQLRSAAEDQGCCINTYQDFYLSISGLDYRHLYSACSANLAGDCNSSPLSFRTSASTQAVFNIAFMVTALCFYVIFG